MRIQGNQSLGKNKKIYTKILCPAALLFPQRKLKLKVGDFETTDRLDGITGDISFLFLSLNRHYVCFRERESNFQVDGGKV